ncbi:MAG: 30S ribosomal protein S17 [Candidatus Omnitrophica bacterium]|nr:30S ribosomal protein S17 [Candidatus Omnitrophota bacterium]
MVESPTKKKGSKERVGVVISNKMQKTIVVQIKRRALHRVYGKVIEKAKKFKVHDEKNEAKVGDTVRIVETRPLSKEKRWRLVQIIGHGQVKVADEIKDVLAESVPPAPPVKEAVRE